MVSVTVEPEKVNTVDSLKSPNADITEDKEDVDVEDGAVTDWSHPPSISSIEVSERNETAS